MPKEGQKESASYLILKTDPGDLPERKCKDLPSEERLARRQATIKPLVDALFAYLKQHENEVGADKCLCRVWWKNRDIFGGQYEAHEPAE